MSEAAQTTSVSLSAALSTASRPMPPEGEAQAPVTIIAPALGFIARQGLAWLEQSSGERQYVQGELRIVTVLFLDLHGFTAMSERMAPDEVTQIMNRCFERLTATVARFDGYVDKYVGDAMMVLFGAPVAHADDPERAVRAALALQEELLRFNQHQKADVKLQMRIGINTGEVLAGRIGAGEYGQYTVMGDAVNLASRLEHAARVGHILVGETTHRFTRHV